MWRTLAPVFAFYVRTTLRFLRLGEETMSIYYAMFCYLCNFRLQSYGKILDYARKMKKKWQKSAFCKETTGLLLCKMQEKDKEQTSVIGVIYEANCKISRFKLADQNSGSVQVLAQQKSRDTATFCLKNLRDRIFFSNFAAIFQK